MHKAELRKIYKEKRAALSAEQIQNYSAQINQNAFDVFGQKNKIISLFFSIENHKEVDTKTLFNSFKNVFCTITGSVSNFQNKTLTHIEVNDLSDLRPNAFNIPEPQKGNLIDPGSFDLVFVPLLVCDQRGYRVGYGKGFYDRFLAECSDHCQFVGLNFFEPIEIIEDLDNFDIPLTHLVTPQDVIEFK